MCCLFGMLNYSGMKYAGADELVNYLAQEATERGTDSTGIAYNKAGKLIIYKKPRSAFEMDFKGLESCICVSGHTRHATQGSHLKNYNNHPFMGKCDNIRFALSHNGVLWNDSMLKKQYSLPADKIQTDSFVAVQLLEKFGMLNAENVSKMAELVQGSFTFTMTDNNDSLWIVKGSSPFSLVHFPDLELYVYASTDNILFTALCRTELVEEIKSGNFEMIRVKSGDIIQIDKWGQLKVNRFQYTDDFGMYDWRNYTSGSIMPYAVGNYWEDDYNQQYLDDLKAVARSFGIDGEFIDELYNDGFMLEEIEDFLYSYDK